jgi:hypothetical protein
MLNKCKLIMKCWQEVLSNMCGCTFPYHVLWLLTYDPTKGWARGKQVTDNYRTNCESVDELAYYVRCPRGSS